MKSNIVYCFLFTFLLAPFVSFSQETLKNEIMAYEQSRHDFLDKGRRMLLENFEKNDIPKTKDIKDLLLKENEGNVYNTFYPIEYIYLLYWTEDYKELTDFIKQVDFNHPVSNSVAILARVDNLYPTLIQKTIEHKDILLIAIQNSSETDMDKDFLALQLEDIIRAGGSSGGIDFKSEQTLHINDLSDAFLEKYPDSPYDKVIRETIRFKFEESPWTHFFDVGLGPVIHQGGLSNYINSSGFYAEGSYDLRYKKLIGILGLGVSAQSLKKDIEINNTIWENGKHSNIFNIFLNAGYEVIETGKWRVYPFLGIGYQGFSANEKDSKENPALKNLNLNSLFTQVGFGIDYIYNNTQTSQLHYVLERVSLKYSYRLPKYEKKYMGMDGFTHCIVVSWGMGGRKNNRVK